MGYDIHITRAEEWSAADEAAVITAEEWLEYVKRDPELKLAGYNGPCFTLWSGQSRSPEPWFDWMAGDLYTKNPDPPIIAKAIEIAQALGARVQGDDGEIYLPDGQIEQDGEVQSGPKMDWRKW